MIPDKLGAHGPIAQGSIWITGDGDTLLEIPQRAKMLAALMNRRAMDAGNSTMTQDQQQGLQCMHVYFHPGWLWILIHLSSASESINAYLPGCSVAGHSFADMRKDTVGVKILYGDS